MTYKDADSLALSLCSFSLFVVLWWSYIWHLNFTQLPEIAAALIRNATSPLHLPNLHLHCFFTWL